jgi:molybdopterin-containing oxidoreductase family membrane subunit
LSLLTSGALSFNFWVGEILLGAVVPILILLTPRLRRIPLVRMMALALVVGGVVAYRWDTNMVGQLVMLTYLPQEIIARYTDYVPSLIEFLTGAGIVAYGLIAFTLGVRYLNIVDHRAAPEAEHEVRLALAAGD